MFEGAKTIRDFQFLPDNSIATSAARAMLAYDANGNLSGDRTWTYGYDLDNRLNTASKSGLAATLTYDAEGRLRQSTIAGTVTNLAY